MAYNHGREDRKWRIWKEAEENCTVEGKLTVTGSTCNAGGLIGTLDRNIT
ncbi:hypothetical protein [Eubacterium callanderi]|nr:hypothetical protein [Eubacterium callanderi]MCQ4823085.1 hypothetical protein [Eubacterium callanderi]